MELSYEEIKNRVLAEVPETCPICGGHLTLSADYMHLTCDNPDCDGKVSRKLEIAAKALGIDNIGPAVAKELFEYLNVSKVYQLFDLTLDDFKKVPRYKDGMAQRLYDSIKSVKSVPFAKFIRACQFKRVGDGSADAIALAYSSVQEFLDTDRTVLVKTLGVVSEDVADQIWLSVQQSRDAVTELSKRIAIEYPEKVSGKGNPTGGQLICVVTGPLGFGSRPEFQEVFGAAYGIKWASAVSKNTDILVTNETTPTGKYKKAQELIASGGKVKIMNEEEFLSYIGAEHSTTADARIDATKTAVGNLQSFDGSVVDL